MSNPYYCEHCGGPLDPRTNQCPYCGPINKEKGPRQNVTPTVLQTTSDATVAPRPTTSTSLRESDIFVIVTLVISFLAIFTKFSQLDSTTLNSNEVLSILF